MEAIANQYYMRTDGYVMQSPILRATAGLCDVLCDAECEYGLHS